MCVAGALLLSKKFLEAKGRRQSYEMGPSERHFILYSTE